MRGRDVIVWIVLVAAAALTAMGCERNASGHTRLIRVWSHQGQESENRAMRQIADAFNLAHAAQNVRVDLIFFPDFQYTEKVSIAAAARDLPDVFELDGPLVARFVDGGLLVPLEQCFSSAELEDFLPTIRQQGTIDGHLYALGAFDSAMVLYFDRAMLAAAGVEPAPEDRGWSWEQFMSACAKLKQAGMQPVSLHMNETADEWYTYAFSPVVWSGGGTLISPDGTRVRGILASDANIDSLTKWQSIFALGYAAKDPVDPDPFGSGSVAMDWTGHWMARSHLQKKGDRLGAMPLPRSGQHGAAPCGSWCWGISSNARDPQLASLWLRWVTDSQHGIEPIVSANGAVPARQSAFAAFPEFEQIPYRVFREQLQTSARPRPRTPYYATLTRHFAAALRDVARGADVGSRLRQAEDEIQRVIDRKTGIHPPN